MVNMSIFAKKSLGQNFLKNEGVLQKIAEAGEMSSNDIVLEVGPGEGALTEKLLEKAGKVIAVEKDHRLISILEEKFKKEILEGKFKLFEGDILEDDTEKWGIKNGEFKIIANIPYYITGLFFRKFLSGPINPTKIVVLVQKEIADRIIARDGKESLLSISVKAYGTPSLVMKVSKGSFVPAPKVDSAVLLIDNISKNFFKNFNEDKFFEILKTGFAHKRKILMGNLKEYNVSEVFSELGFSEKIRAEDLRLEDWGEIVENI